MVKDKDYWHTTATEPALSYKWSFNAGAATGHVFCILMACSGALRGSRSGTG